MELKKRTPSKELQLLEILSYRGNLLEKDKQHYLHLKKGYEGEVRFDQILESQLQCDYLIIKDLLLTFHQSTFQIDTLVIFPNILEFFEIKNFEGEYTYDRGKFYKNKDYNITNPEHQLERAETLLRQLLHHHGIKIPIKPTVVFVNPEFTLFNAPTGRPFILPSQINSFLKRMNMNNTSKITNRDKSIAQKLLSLHQEDNPYESLPSYTYESIRKGIVCRGCSSFSIILKGHYCYCNSCSEREGLASAVIRTVREFNLLFPDLKITNSNVYDWCRIIPTRQRVKRILIRNFQLNSNRRWSYYDWKSPGE